MSTLFFKKICISSKDYLLFFSETFIFLNISASNFLIFSYIKDIFAHNGLFLLHLFPSPYNLVSCHPALDKKDSPDSER